MPGLSFCRHCGRTYRSDTLCCCLWTAHRLRYALRLREAGGLLSGCARGATTITDFLNRCPASPRRDDWIRLAGAQCRDLGTRHVSERLKGSDPSSRRWKFRWLTLSAASPNAGSIPRCLPSTFKIHPRATGITETHPMSFSSRLIVSLQTKSVRMQTFLWPVSASTPSTVL